MLETTLSTLTPAEFARLPLFHSINLGDVEDIVMNCPLSRVERGAVVVRAGERAERMYVVIRGSLSVRLGSTEAPPISVVGRGGVFGEISAIDGAGASAFVVAEERSRLMTLSRDALWALFARSPHMAINMMDILTRRLRETDARLMAMQQGDAAR